MPELPEVETVVRGLRAPLVGRTITGLWTDWPKALRPHTPDDFAALLTGQTVHAITRRAKYILCQLDDGLLAIHLKMTGRLYVSGAPESGDRWVHVRFTLDNGQYLHFSDARRFGRVYLAPTLDDFAPGLGPEPLEDDFTPAVLRERLARRQRALKALLLDQAFLAGVGNIYADEALFRAGLHPRRAASTLTDDETHRLYDSIRAALRAGIDYEGASVNWYRKPDGTAGKSQEHFFVYGRDGQPCARCGQPIVKIRVAQRGTHYCPNCQPER